MHVLTSDKTTRSQISLLLRELGYMADFYDRYAALIDAVSRNKGNTANFGNFGSSARADSNFDELLIDLEIGLSDSELAALKESRPNSKLIGFQRYTENTPISTNQATNPTAGQKSKGYTSLIILPSHAERAKARLKSAIRAQTADNVVTRAKITRAPFGFSRSSSANTRQMTKGFAPKTMKADLSVRYLTAHSTAAIHFAHSLKNECNPGATIILSGDEGAELELAAREYNYQFNQDSSPLHTLSGDDICMKELEQLEQQANRNKEPITCYVGRSEDLNEEAIHQLDLFRQYLNNLRNPHMQLVLAHESGSEAFFHMGVEEPFRQFFAKAKVLKIPPLIERAEDIAPICLTLLGTLRSAHPFLMVEFISKEAINFLTEKRAELSHAKLVRAIRNAVALTQRKSLCIEDLKNYGESDIVNQHLLETMADERFFEEQQSANF